MAEKENTKASYWAKEPSFARALACFETSLRHEMKRPHCARAEYKWQETKLIELFQISDLKILPCSSVSLFMPFP